MKHAAPWIVAISAVVLCVFILASERDAMEDDAATWRSEQDSLRAELDHKSFQLDSLRAYTDSLKAYTDSAVMTYPPPPVVIKQSLKFFEFAPLGTAIDTLNAE